MSNVPHDGATEGSMDPHTEQGQAPVNSRPRRRATIGILALAALASVFIVQFAPFALQAFATMAALVLGLIAAIGGYGRWWGIGALVLASGLVVVTIASVVGGFTFNPRQQSLIDRAATIKPPVGFVLLQEPIGVGWCGYIQLTCDEAEVLWRYTPSDESALPSEICESYLLWAKEQGVDTVFLVSDTEWRSWIDLDIVSQREKGGPYSFAVDSDAALEACGDLVAHPRAAGDGIDKAMNLVGVQHDPGSYAEVFVARITEPKSIPDGNPDDGSSWPFMIMGGLHASK